MPNKDEENASLEYTCVYVGYMWHYAQHTFYFSDIWGMVTYYQVYIIYKAFQK